MKVVSQKYKEAPVEYYVMQFTPEELRYIRYLAQDAAGAAARLFDKLDFVKDVPLNGIECFND